MFGNVRTTQEIYGVRTLVPEKDIATTIRPCDARILLRQLVCAHKISSSPTTVHVTSLKLRRLLLYKLVAKHTELFETCFPRSRTACVHAGCAAAARRALVTASIVDSSEFELRLGDFVRATRSEL